MAKKKSATKKKVMKKWNVQGRVIEAETIREAIEIYTKETKK